MQDHGIGTLVVVDGDNRAVGMVTDRDIALRCVAEARDPGQTSLQDIMSSPVCSVVEDTPIESALATMPAAEVRRAVVIDSEGKLVGILALDDVLELLIEEAEAIGSLLRAQASA
jgi:CBS domain-containing protein